MRYAKNLAAGHGLTWNSGEAPLEGYTNFLWVIFMAGLHLFALPAGKVSLLVQLSALLILCTHLVYIRRIADIIGHHSFWTTTCALILTAFYFPLIKWSLMGMETSAATLIVSMASYSILKTLRENRFSPLCYFLLGIGTLVRIDLFLLSIVAFIFLTITDRWNRKKHIFWGGGILFVFLSAQTIFRLWYFGDVLPNTYYLKMTGFPIVFRITNGLHNAFHFIYGMNAFLFLLPFGILPFRREKEVWLCAIFFIAQVCYSIYTGGDITDAEGLGNRFHCIVMPLFFVMFSYAFVSLGNYFIKATHQLYASRAYLFHAGYSAAFVLCIVYLNAGPSLQYLNQWLLREPMKMVSANQRMVESAHYLQKITTPEATIAVTWAGTLPYFLNRPIIDLLGKNDRTIAHMKVDFPKYVSLSNESKYTAFMPGHTKWDYEYSIGKLKPDIVWQLFPDQDFQLTGTAVQAAFSYLYGVYIVKRYNNLQYFVKQDAKTIYFDKL